MADESPRYRQARLWLEATLRKTAVRQALDPANLRTRILLADAVGLGRAD
ncbi:MAG: hypothetical protein ACRDNZ_04055 [Streptosporangiaceae bacterium]